MPSFIAVDWGTSSFRLWVVGARGEVLASADAPFGMSRLKRSDFANVLEETLTKLRIGPDVPAVICGMAGAAQGWCEAPYLSVPTQLDELGNGAVKVRGSLRDVRILPGVKQRSPANVMRGEETQIAGFLCQQPEFEGTVCLPGTHTKWVHVSDATIQDFETCMTGEQFAMFSERSVLSHSMILDGWSAPSFDEAVKTAAEDPASVSRRFFSIRANMLIADQTSAEARATLSGLLIGQELMAVGAYWQENPIVLIGDTFLCNLYQQALTLLGADSCVMEGTDITLRGLHAAHKLQRERSNA